MDPTEAFLDATMPRLRQAETALHNGDAGPRMAMWSHDHSVTLFGGAMGGSGWAEIEPIFRRLAASFSDCSPTTTRSSQREPTTTSPTRSPSSTPPPPSTGAHPRRTCCGSPPSSAARTASGRWCTVMPTRRITDCWQRPERLAASSTGWSLTAIGAPQRERSNDDEEIDVPTGDLDGNRSGCCERSRSDRRMTFGVNKGGARRSPGLAERHHRRG